MSDPQYTYRFAIDAYDLGSLPMARLAEYMADLARLFGNADHVHFDRLEAGSAVLVQHVDPEVGPIVQKRLSTASQDAAPADVAEPLRAINLRLAKDNASGSLMEAGGDEIIRFPGCGQPQPRTFGPFRQQCTFDGMLIRVGGKDDTVPVHLQDRTATHICNATRDMARNLAPHLYRGTLRVWGDGRWERDEDGKWILKRFDISKFELLDDAPLSQVVQRLREVEGSGWKDIEDPAAELDRLRQETDERP